MIDYSNEKFDIIIQAGQSNAEGSGIGDVEREYEPTEKVLYLLNEKKVELVENELKIEFFDKPFVIEVADKRCVENLVIGDFSLTFAEEYVKAGKLSEGRRLLIVRAAIGGTGFYKKQWGLEFFLYKKMREMVDYALGLNAENRVVAMLWHQGEHEAAEGNEPAVYKAQLTDQFEDVRQRYGRDFPIVAGDFCYEWKGKYMNVCKPITDVICEVLEKDGRAAFVETEDLLSNNQKTGNGDDIHFCRESLMTLGRRYYKAFTQIKD